MTQSIYSVGVGVGGDVAPVRDRSREIQSFRGLMIGIGLSVLLWVTFTLAMIALGLL